MPDMPQIVTERLLLRPHRLEIMPISARFGQMRMWCAISAETPSTAEASWLRLMNRPGMWHFMGFGFLVIEERQTGRFVGEAGFHEVRRDMKPSLVGTLETGWVLLPEFHGKGYALEAMQALLDWADSHFTGRK